MHSPFYNAVLKSTQKFYTNNVEKWLQSHPEFINLVGDIVSLIGKCFNKAAKADDHSLMNKGNTEGISNERSLTSSSFHHKETGLHFIVFAINFLTNRVQNNCV